MLDRLINQQGIHFVLYGNTYSPKRLFCPIHWLTISICDAVFQFDDGAKGGGLTYSRS